MIKFKKIEFDVSKKFPRLKEMFLDEKSVKVRAFGSTLAPTCVGTSTAEVVSPGMPGALAAVNAVYLFGSYGRGIINPLSDVDIAVLLYENYKRACGISDIKDNLLRLTQDVLGTEEVDLAVLNISSTILKYHVIRDGKLLLVKDSGEEQKFREKTISLYLDTKRIRDEYFSYLKKDFLSGEVGNGYRSREYQSAYKRAQRLYR